MSPHRKANALIFGTLVLCAATILFSIAGEVADQQIGAIGTQRLMYVDAGGMASDLADGPNHAF